MKRGLFAFLLLFASIRLSSQTTDTSQPGDVLINEVMVYTTNLTLLPKTEYVEIYNATNDNMPLDGWRFVYDGKETALPDMILPAGSYAVLYRAGRDITVASGGIELGLAQFPSTLANTGKTIGLQNSLGVMIDAYTYPNATESRSFERKDDGTWQLSYDPRGGTPGEANSKPPADIAQPGDVYINEVMVYTNNLTLLPQTEYVEIYNASNVALPLYDWNFIYEGSKTALPNMYLPAGSYLVLYREGRYITVAPGAIALGLDKFPSTLANAGRTIGLENSTGVLIDSYTYPNATESRSFERKDDGTWQLSYDPRGGTPGEANSKPPADIAQPGDIYINEVMVYTNNLTLLPQTEYVEIYNASNVALPLYDWNFVYEGSKTALPNMSLPAGSYLVLYRESRYITVAPGAIALGLDKFPSTLAITGRTIGLENSTGVLIDAYTYPNATESRSFERKDDGTWQLSYDPRGGTPGEANSKPPADIAQPGDIYINEVMVYTNNLTLLPQTEYVEIYNASNVALPLYDWNFIYEGSKTALPNMSLPAGSYLVLYREGRYITVAPGAIALGLDKFPSTLAITGRTIGLENSTGVLIDAYTYPNATESRSFERKDDGTWQLSYDARGGTPGEANSKPPADIAQPGDIYINEVMVYTNNLTLLPQTEYVEIYNASNVALPLYDWNFIYEGSKTALPNMSLPAGSYLVLYREGRNITVAPGAIALGLDKFPSTLANAGRNIGLENSTGVLIDTYTYPNATESRSFERKDDGTWQLSYDLKGGTPGEANSKPPADIAQLGDIYINEVMVYTNNLTLLPQTEYVEIYNASNVTLPLYDWNFIYEGSKTALPNMNLPAGSYLVLYREGRNITVAPGAIALGLDKFPSTLAITGRTIGLENSTGVMIDSYTYPNATESRSFERKDDGTWQLSYDARGGTPGEANSKPPADIAQPGDIYINEVMVYTNNLTLLPQTEYVEIYNASNVALPLYDWNFIYEGSKTALPNMSLPAGSYLVLYREGRNITVAPGAIALGLDKFPSTLAITGRTIGLENSTGVIIDSYTYPNATESRSFERKDDGAWQLSYDARGGTPGEVNSKPPADVARQGDIYINEVMVYTSNLTLLPQTEYVEIYNASNVALPLYDWNFIYDGSPTALPNMYLPAGGYLVLYRAGRDIKVASGAIALGLDRFPSTLANTGKTIGLQNSRGEMIDAYSYPSATESRSFERTATGIWYLSYDTRGGTPGEANSMAPADIARPGDIYINEVMVYTTNLTLLPQTEYVELYNASNAAIPLYDWNFIYDGNKTALPNMYMPARSYLVLYRAGRDIKVASGAIALGLDRFPSALANTGKTIGLQNSREEMIDTYAYPAATVSRSFERTTTGTWQLSYDTRGGTPGEANSIPPADIARPGDLYINEVMVYTNNLTLLPKTEYVEIYNASSAAIPLYDWNFIYDGNKTALPNMYMPARSYLVLYRAGRDITVATGAIALGLDRFPSALANTGKTIGLQNSKGDMIDEYTYPNATESRSFERTAAGTWQLSYDERGGTPGETNSKAPPPPVLPDDIAAPGDVLINEVMANPSGLTLLPETEYVEIYNISNKDLPLHGWNFIYNSRETALPVTILPAGGYAVLFRAGRDITVAVGGMSLGLSNFPSALTNTGNTIGLVNSKGEMIDVMDYPVATAAKSYERANDGAWHLCFDERGGTPGEVNSEAPPPPVIPEDIAAPGDVLINEVMANPSGLTLLPETEYVEIYNISDKDIPLHGWHFIYNSRETALPDTILPAGEYAVLYRAGHDITVAEGGMSLGLNDFPSALVNTGNTIDLANSKGETIDEMDYPVATAAKSYERADDGAWHLCYDERGGTPGEVNSEAPPPPVIPDDIAVPGDVLINEVMANPTGLTLLPETEYVEIYNISDKDIPLHGWNFIYNSRETALPDTILPAGVYVVLYRAGRDITVAEGGMSLGLNSFPAALTNTGNTIGLINSKGDVIDILNYPSATAAKSYERDDDGAWHLSYDEKGGTPGAVNSQPAILDPSSPFMVNPLELVINEILPEQFIGGSEYIELYNRSNRPLSLAGLAVSVRRTNGTLNTLYPLSDIKEEFLPGSYIVLTSEYNGVVDFYQSCAPESVYEVRMPILNNEGATIVLYRISDETIIDEVSYLAKWHDPAIKSKKGVSLERIDCDNDSNDASNWTSATSDIGYGTPGMKNSQYSDGNNDGANFISSPEYVPGMDNYILSYRTDKSGYRCRAEVYTINGRKTGEISNNQLLSQEGDLRWDGRGLDGSRLAPGLYIFYAELYHPDGNQMKFKKAFLVK